MNIKFTQNIKTCRILSILFISCVLLGCTEQPNTKEYSLTDEERMEWWTEARFGMFIHWGIYSVPAGTYKGNVQRNSAEWIMNRGKIPIVEYEKYAEQFNPTHFNADEFVALAKEAGMKYMVITAKHHDGFSMFHSKSSPYNVVDATPFKRDVMKELADACAKEGIKFGFYYSQSQDWRHPGGMGNNWDKSIKRVSSDEYLHEKTLPEVNQLLTDYGPIGIFWWDTPRKMSKEIVDSLYKVTTDLQPEIITNDRLGYEYPGDHKTYERHLPKFKPDAKYWEICQPISASWGYKSSDKDFKSIPTLIRNLIDASSMGGNYLLNVSPTSQGTLAPEAVTRLKAVGKWLKTNKESIYGTQASPCGKPDWGRITTKSAGDKTTFYLHVYDWQENAELPIEIRNDAASCYLLADKSRKFATKIKEGRLTVKLSGPAPDSVASVIVLKLAEKPDVIPPKPFGQNDEGIVAFYNERAQFQNLHGPSARYNSSKDCIGKWSSATALVYWTFVIDYPGVFHITCESAGKNNSEFTVELAGQTKRVKIPATGRDDIFKNLDIGKFEIKKPGEYKITFTPVAGKWKAFNFRNVVMTPVQ
ncbi:MAG: glycosyl hydrolase [Calditrichaeota bacterium]|nr:MAG: glycosyl hydrolase [Calditrichota bacterium]